MGMKAESIKKILAGLAIDFVEGQKTERAVYLYDTDVNIAGTPYPLPINKAIKVTFEYVDVIASAQELKQSPHLAVAIEALDVLGMSLIDHGHQWTPYERSLYEQGTRKDLASIIKLVTGNRFDQDGNELNLKADPDFFNMSDNELDI